MKIPTGHQVSNVYPLVRKQSQQSELPAHIRFGQESSADILDSKSGGTKSEKKTLGLKRFLLPMVVAMPFLVSAAPSAVGQNTPKTVQTPASDNKTDDTKKLEALDQLLQTNAKQIDSLDGRLKAQQKQLDNFDTIMKAIQGRTTYEAFVKSKHQAIQKAQAAQFLISLPEVKTENGTTYTVYSKSAPGWVAKDNNGKLVLLTSATELKDTIEKNGKQPEFELSFANTSFKTTLAKKLPGDQSAYSYSQGLAILELPTDEKILAKLKTVALPIPNYVGKKIASGTETLAVGPQFDMLRYATQGIVSEHDIDGVRKHGSQEKQFPAIWTDAGTNTGSFGAPLLGYNWESNQWDVIGMSVGKKNDLMSIAVPTDVIQIFLQKRGYETVDAKDKKQVSQMKALIAEDLSPEVKQLKIIELFLDDTFTELGVNQEKWLKDNKLTRADFASGVQKRLAKLLDNDYKKQVDMTALDPDKLSDAQKTLLKEATKRAVTDK